MILKKITCTVSEKDKEAFSIAQTKWTPLKKVNGFLGQVGGWDLIDSSKACIYAFWENKEVYDYFMNTVHDNIFLHNNQAKTYSSIDVELFETDIRIEKEIVSVLKNSHFIGSTLTNKQEIPKNQNMLGCEVGVSLKNSNRFIEFTGWLHKEDYDDNKTLQRTNQNIVAIEQFYLEHSWRVIPLER